MKRSPEKHLHFFALLDALESDACPCRRYVTRARAQVRQSLIYKTVTIAAFGGRFRIDTASARVTPMNC